MFHTMPKPIASKMTENTCHQWGLGRNKISSDAKAFIQKTFEDGLKKRPAVASEVEILMQEVNNEDGLPRFDRNSYLDEDQGGFQLLDLIVMEIKSHMTCYNSMPLIA